MAVFRHADSDQVPPAPATKEYELEDQTSCAINAVLLPQGLRHGDCRINGSLQKRRPGVG
jgi:hypothetical protein